MTDQHQPLAGWYPDPVARFSERYWDGTKWTERVRDGVVEAVDPEWATGGVASSGGVPGGVATQVQTGVGTHNVVTVGSSSGGHFDRDALNAEVMRPRPAPRVQEALAAMGGVIAFSGLILLLVWIMLRDAGSTSGRGELGLIGVITLAAAYAWVVVGPRGSRAAGLTGALLGPVLIVVAIFGGDTSGDPARIATFLVLAAAWGAMFFGPGFTGAPILLAFSVLSAWGAVIVAVNSSSDRYVDPFGSQSKLPFDNPADLETTVGIISLIFALGCVVAAGVADSRGARVLATPLLAVAVIQSSVGMSTAVQSPGGTGLLAILVGGAFIVVGARGQRRGSLWLGAATATLGVFALILAINDEPTGVGVLTLIVGVVLVLAAPAVDRALSVPQPGERLEAL